MTALIVIGSILLLLFLLAMLNLKFYIRYEGEEVTLKLGILCFWKQLVPYTEKEKKRARRAFFAQCTHIDYEIRLLIGTLRESNLLDDTIIVFTSDHGDMLFK